VMIHLATARVLTRLRSEGPLLNSHGREAVVFHWAKQSSAEGAALCRPYAPPLTPNPSPSGRGELRCHDHYPDLTVGEHRLERKRPRLPYPRSFEESALFIFLNLRFRWNSMRSIRGHRVLGESIFSSVWFFNNRLSGLAAKNRRPDPDFGPDRSISWRQT
jgi:hypothetical protein